jgi:CCR4-NOT complex subunit CAF16
MMIHEEKKMEDVDNDNASSKKNILTVQNLNFSYNSSSNNNAKNNNNDLHNLNCIIPPNSKVILVGANGSGKSTLIRTLTGMIWGDDVTYDLFDINGSSKVNDQVNGVAYLGERWKRRRTGFEGVCPYTLDTTPSEMFVKWQQDHPDRRDELIKVLGINMEWRMNECSDGQRKKVRLMFKLLKPFTIAIIDEFAADLDIFSRKRFFDYLSKECETRGASVVFATHIFDQVDLWASHVMFMKLDGTLSDVYHIQSLPLYQEILERSGDDRAMCPMYTLILEEMERQYKEDGGIDMKLVLNGDNVVDGKKNAVVKKSEKAKEEEEEEKPVIIAKNLNFSYIKGKPTISNLNLIVPPNSKILLVGANGAGKSTLIRMLTGQIWTGMEYDEFSINGASKPNDQNNGVCYLGNTWKRQQTGFNGICPYTIDCAASEMFVKWQEEHVERRDELVKVLGIDLNWRMNECSDGQRKKVQIMIKLLKPFQVCIIDEFVADLDILSRSHFFDYMSKECEERGASVIYATHIFDLADSWASHIAFMQLDRVLSPIHRLDTLPAYKEILARSGDERAMCPMYVLVMEELRRQYRESGLFIEDYNKNDGDEDLLVDVIMSEQCKEQAANRFDAEREKDQNNWTAGRLTAQFRRSDEEAQRAKRVAARLEAERNAAGNN